MKLWTALCCFLALTLSVDLAMGQPGQGQQRPAFGQNQGERPGFGQGQQGGRQGFGRQGDQEGQRPDRRQFTLPIIAALDKNSDNKLDAEEIAAAVASLKTLDKNSDGEITMDEMMPQRQPGFGGPGAPGDDQGRGGFSMEGMLERFDTNGDGKVTKADAADDERRAGMIERMDANGDGEVTAEEMQQGMRQMMQDRGGFRGQRGGQGTPNGQGGFRGQRGAQGGQGGQGRPARPAEI